MSGWSGSTYAGRWGGGERGGGQRGTGTNGYLLYVGGFFHLKMVFIMVVPPPPPRHFCFVLVIMEVGDEPHNVKIMSEKEFWEGKNVLESLPPPPPRKKSWIHRWLSNRKHWWLYLACSPYKEESTWRTTFEYQRSIHHNKLDYSLLCIGYITL